MSKKLDVREYQCELIRVVDGDTIDCYIDLGFNLKVKKRVRYMGIDTWESRTRDKEEKVKGLAAKPRNKELLEAGTFKIVSYGTGKFGRVLGEVFVQTDDGLVSVNETLISEGHAYEYDGGKKKKFITEIETEKSAKKDDLIDKPAEEND